MSTRSNKFKAAFHANLQGFIFNVKLNHQNAQSYGFFRHARAHSMTVAFSAKLHGLYVNANLATSNLVGQTKSRISKLRKLGYSVRFRMRHIRLKCRSVHVRCKSELRKWPSSSKQHSSGSAAWGSKEASPSRCSLHPATSHHQPPRPLSQSVCSPEKLAGKVEEFLHSPQQMLVQMIVQLLRFLHRKLPLTWLRDVGKLYFYEAQVTGKGTGFLPLVSSYLVEGRQRGATLLQTICLLATLLLLLNLTMAALLPRLGLCISTSTFGLFLDYLGLLPHTHNKRLRLHL